MHHQQKWHSSTTTYFLSKCMQVTMKGHKLVKSRNIYIFNIKFSVYTVHVYHRKLITSYKAPPPSSNLKWIVKAIGCGVLQTRRVRVKYNASSWTMEWLRKWRAAVERRKEVHWFWWGFCWEWWRELYSKNHVQYIRTFI